MAEIPTLKKIQERFGSKDFALLGISLDKSREALDNKIKEAGVTWTIGFDGKFWETAPVVQYNLRSIPSNWLIDRDGTIRKRDPSEHDLEGLVAELVEGKGAKPFPASGEKKSE